MSEKSYDLLFLDINLPVISGIDLLEKLKNPPYVIFTTAYNEYALKAFELSAVDYLLKPFSEERFRTAVDKSINVLKSNAVTGKTFKLGFSFKEEDNYYLLPYDEIVYFSSKGRHTIVHTNTKIHDIPQTLKDVGQKLPSDMFLRVHKQYIINVKFISHIQYFIAGQYMAYLKDSAKTSILIGKIYASDLLRKLSI